MILKALQKAGWTIGDADDMHTAMSRKVAGQGGPEMKSYWQCLLELPRLFANGVEGVRSRQHPLYYTALCNTKTPSLVLPGMKVSYYTAIVQGASPTDAAMAGAPSKPQVMIDGDDSDDLICVSGPSSGSSWHAPERAGTCATPEAKSPENVAEDPEDALVSIAKPTGFRQHAAITGIPGLTLLFDEHLTPGQAGHYRRVAVMCPLCDSGHKRDIPCKKYRNIGEAQSSLGPQEPVAYLAVWAGQAQRFATAKQHIAFRPSPEVVKEYMRSHGWLSE
jgi:hypothetical protein